MSITTSGICRLAGLALLVLTVGGCGSTGKPDQPASPSAGVSTSTSAGSTASASASSTDSPSATSSASPSASPATAVPGCATPGLRASVSPGDGAAGSTFYSLRLTNTSARPCRTGGFGGVSLVSTPTGPPIGAPADRVRKGQAKPLTLPPGGYAEAVLQVVEAGNFSQATCRPVAAKGLRVYPPNETRSLFVALAATACRSGQAHLLSLSPYRLGT